MKLNKLTILACVLLFMNSTHADIIVPSSYCSKPYKPYKFNSEWELKQYLRDVESYQRCIADFVEKQNKEIRNHQQAASDAIDEWNRFVKYEMK